MDYVDVVFCHRPDFETPLEETCFALDWCIEKGLAFYWGTSEWPVDRIARAIEICDRYDLHKPVVEQCQYNLLVRDTMENSYRKIFKE